MVCGRYLVVGTNDIYHGDIHYSPTDYYKHWFTERNTIPSGFPIYRFLREMKVIPMYNEKLPKLSGENGLKKNYQISKRGGVL